MARGEKKVKCVCVCVCVCVWGDCEGRGEDLNHRKKKVEDEHLDILELGVFKEAQEDEDEV